tara:strand:+ start:120 stop:1004 length:885 start_codon:yes stop_codon:yes gene_type:complete
MSNTSYLTNEYIYDIDKSDISLQRNDGNDYEFPIENIEELQIFYSVIKDKDGLQNSANAIKLILDNSSNNLDEIYMANADYYYKLISSLLSKTFHDTLLQSNPFFIQLKQFSVISQQQQDINMNEIQRVAENANHNWKYDSKHLKHIFTELRKNKTDEYVRLIDDNSTLMRQGQMNRDLMIRQEMYNEFLKYGIFFICILNIIGYTYYIGASLKFATALVVITCIVFGICFIITFVKYQSELPHALNFNKISFKGFPIKNEIVQKKYTEDCKIDSTFNNYKFIKSKCPGKPSQT